MPFNKEKANKFSHEKIINNQFLKDKISSYKIIYDIDESTGTKKNLEGKFKLYCSTEARKIDFIFSVDSSFTEIPINDEIPSAKMGIVNFSSNIIDLGKKSDIYDNGFINPQTFNDIYNSKILTFICPTFNLIPKDGFNSNIVDAIRREIYTFYYESNPFNSVKLIESLFNVISSTTDKIKLKCTNNKCVSNNTGTENDSNNLILNLNDIGIEPFKCPYCNKEMYLTDYLRLHEAVDEDFGHNNILSRLAQVTEHLLAINLIDSLIKYKSYDLLSRTAFIIDGPLAIYGEPAKIHKGLLKYLHFNSNKIGYEIVYFGILKTGKLKEHFMLIDKKINIKENSYLLVDDKYRFKYIQRAPENNKFFGQEVLFGQDYLFYSKDRKKFVISMLYPFENKKDNFEQIAFIDKNYNNLALIFNLINEISIDMYEDAILPIALSHKYAAISLNPGTNILEKFVKNNL